MKALAAFILILLPWIVQAQSETNNFVTYDTTISVTGSDGINSGIWKVRIHRPVNMFTVGNADTASRPAIIFMSGQGEQGTTDSSKLAVYGPFYWLQHGWDGSITLGNGKHYPILMCAMYTQSVTPNPSQYYQILYYLLTHYHIKHPLRGYPNSFTGTGLSEGSFNTMGVVEFEDVLGDHKGMQIFRAVAGLEGTPTSPANEFPNRPQNCSGQWCDTNYYKTAAKLYGLNVFYLEGSGSDNFRDGWHYTKAINDTVSTQPAYFSYENLGGGAHCCWNSMYDPSVTNWSCVAPMGPNNAPSQLGTNTMGNYFVPSNIFTWMLRQGDTSLVGSGGTTTLTVTGAPDTVITLPTNSINLRATAVPPTGASVTTWLWSEVSGGSATITAPSSQNTSVTGLVTGNYIFKIFAKDNLNDTASDTVAITVLSNACRLFLVDTTNANIQVTNAQLGASPVLHRCDTVRIFPYVGAANTDYRSFSVNSVVSQTDTFPGYLWVQFRSRDGRHSKLQPSNSNEFANIWDNNNYVDVDSLWMDDHVDPVFSSYVNTGYSHHIRFRHTHEQGQGTFFSNSAPTITLPNWGGPTDTINCQYDWTWDSTFVDSVKNNYSGTIWLYIGAQAKNAVWIGATIKNSKFGDFPSFTLPSAYVAARNVYGLYMYNDSMWNLGIGPQYTGHAEQIFIQQSYFDIHNMHFGPHNFGNDVRDLGQGEIPGMDWYFTSRDPSYDGRSKFYNIISEHKVKYPVIETHLDWPDTAYNSYYLPRCSPYIDQITFYSGAIGAGNQYYRMCILDGYGGPTDSVYVHNTSMNVLNDSTGAAIWGFSTSQGGVGNILFGFGNPAFADTLYMQSSPYFSTSGLADTVTYLPKQNSVLFRTGVASKPYPAFDILGVPRPTVGPVDLGARYLVIPLPNTFFTKPRGRKYIYH